MKTFQVLRLLTLAGIAPLIAAPSFAQDSYFYGGAGAGKSRTNLDDNRITGIEGGPGLTVSNVSRDSADNAYKVFLGYQFNRNVGVELGYFHLGQFDFNSTTSQGNLNGAVQLQGGNFDVVGTLPFTENFSGIGRIGAQVTRTRDVFTGSGGFTPNNATPSKREVDVKVGVGLQYALNRNFLVRAEVERFRINDAVGNHPNVNMYSVSFVVPFGRSAAPSTPVAMAAPAYVAPTPAPAAPPVVAVAQPPLVIMAVSEPPPAAPAPTRVSYSAESMFGFDRSVLRPEGKAALDAFAQNLRGANFDSITVEGYTDRIGTDAYNQKLSQERADAVKTYLVETGNVDAQKITAVGKGESTPVTKPEDCKGKAATPKLISCLQPDRRVEIEVAGSR
jgi:OOP family OmpA-OmpF porin